MRGLRAVLESLGLQTSEARSGVSNFPELNGIDGHGRSIGEHPNWVETGVVEARKPLPAQGDCAAATAEKQPAIPQKIHFVWLGSELPALFRGLIELCRQLHPGWEIKVWADAEVGSLIASMKTGLLGRFEQHDLSLSTRSDIARHHIMASEGGIYLDCDFLVLKSLSPLRACSLFCVDQGGGFFCAGVFGTVALHPIFAEVFEALRQAEYSQAPHLSAGPHMFHPILSRQLEKDRSAAALSKGFFPVHYDDKYDLKIWERCDLSEVFAAHLWDHSWGDGGGDNASNLYARMGALLMNRARARRG